MTTPAATETHATGPPDPTGSAGDGPYSRVRSVRRMSP
jgi:hypothetical protein